MSTKFFSVGRLGVAAAVLVPSAVLYTSYQRPATQKQKLVNIADLSIYGDPDERVKFVPEQIGVVRGAVSSIRETSSPFLVTANETRLAAIDIYHTGKSHTQSSVDYIQNTAGVVPRMAVITVSGLAGIVLGYKGGYIRKATFSSLAIVTAASLCYPKEAVKLTTDGYNQVKDVVLDATGSIMPLPAKTKEQKKAEGMKDKAKAPETKTEDA